MPSTTAATATPPAEHFADRLAAAIDRAGAPVCVGLDPVIDKLPASLRATHHDPVEAVRAFCLGVVEAVGGAGGSAAPGGGAVVPAIKPQSACFERLGPRGVALLQETIALARRLGLVVVLDAKRGDIGISAAHYAAAAFDAFHADALTISPYLGPDTIEEFRRPAGAGGLFVLVRTSNPGSDAFQSERLADGRTIAELIAGSVAHLGDAALGARGLSDLGAVVGATKPQDAAALRARMPRQIFLVPGYGAQGGTAEDIRGMLRPARTGPGDAGVLVTASRSIIYAFQPAAPDWQAQVRAAAVRLRDEIAGVVG